MLSDSRWRRFRRSAGPPGTMRRQRLAGIPAVAVLALAASACGSSGTTSGASPSATAPSPAVNPAGKSGSRLSACLMVGGLGIDDHGFNQEAWQAFTLARQKYGISIKYLVASGSVTYSTIGSEFISEGCNFIVGEGFETANEIQALAKQNPTRKFVLVDDALTTPLPNVVNMVYQTQQGAFLAGYLAAGVTKKKTIGMFGNEPIPPVENYLNGFYAGVRYYDARNHAHVTTIGWNPKTRSGEFVGNFTDTNKARTITLSELGQGADIIYGVATPNAVGQAVQQAGGPANGDYMIWVDVDGCNPYPQYCNVQLTSVEKNITVSLDQVIQTAVHGAFHGGNYYGTLKNNGVGLAPYHDLGSKVPAALQNAITSVRAQIIAGKVNPDPYSG